MISLVKVHMLDQQLAHVQLEFIKSPQLMILLSSNSENSLVRIVKKDRNSSIPKMRKSDYKDIESKVKSYINSHIKQSEKKIKGIYGRDHNQILSSIKTTDYRNAVQNYVKYSFESNGKSDIISLNICQSPKIIQKVESTVPASDQGDCANEGKITNLNVSPNKESGNTEDIQAYYKIIDSYLDSLKEKGFAIFKYSEEKLDENSNFSYEIYSVEDFYKSKVMLNTNVIDEEKEDDKNEAEDVLNQKYIFMRFEKRWEASIFNYFKIEEFEKSKNLINCMLSKTPAGMHFEDSSLAVFRCQYCVSKKTEETIRWICIDAKCCEQNQPFELCHKDFINIREQPQLIHKIDHKMVCIKYDTEKEHWIVTNQFFSQSGFIRKDFTCKVCHVNLK